MPRPEPETIERASASKEVRGTYTPLGVTDQDGNEYFKISKGGTNKPPPPDIPPSDGGDGAMKFTLPDLRWNVALLNGSALLFLTALVGMFLWLVDRIDDQFDDLNGPIVEVQKSVAGQTAAINGMQRSLDRIESRLDGRNERQQLEQVRQAPKRDEQGR